MRVSKKIRKFAELLKGETQNRWSKSLKNSTKVTFSKEQKNKYERGLMNTEIHSTSKLWIPSRADKLILGATNSKMSIEEWKP